MKASNDVIDRLLWNSCPPGKLPLTYMIDVQGEQLHERLIVTNHKHFCEEARNYVALSQVDVGSIGAETF